MQYICDNKIPADVAKRVVDLLGGRFFYLNKPIRNYSTITDVASANLVKDITEDI